ncbi:unnamed protein product [Protopolystoma xenopodis]|uniref:Uncharacterized protein n=1 Tax=Protopolystoma xenopodis TaxID=117903 RepID=A0A448XDH3_9PLAT|nr:unnamed protein product [Protopolystoma xenopodis]
MNSYCPGAVGNSSNHDDTDPGFTREVTLFGSILTGTKEVFDEACSSKPSLEALPSCLTFGAGSCSSFSRGWCFFF